VYPWNSAGSRQVLQSEVAELVDAEAPREPAAMNLRTTASLLVAMRDCGGGKVPSRTVLTSHKLGELDSRAGPARGRTPVRNLAETRSARLVLTLNSVRSNKRCLLPWSATRLAPALTFGRRGLSRGIGVSLNRSLDALPDRCIFKAPTFCALYVRRRLKFQYD